MAEELRELRLSKQIPAKDMVAVVQAIYPKYDKTVQSKCENGDAYGVSLRPDAMAALYAHFAPELAEGRKAVKKDAHRLTCRISARLETADYEGHDREEDRPDLIQNMERTGYPDGKEPTFPICPVCGEECEEIFRDKDLNIVGCDICIKQSDAWEEPECFPGKEH